MHWAWVVDTEPATEPLSLSDAKDHLRITDATEDSLITAYIVVARKWVENYCDRSIPSQTLKAYFDRFPYDGKCILLPRSPAISITTVEYVDTDGNSQTWGSKNYTIDVINEPSRFDTDYNVSYPSTRSQNNAVTITYTAGYSTVPVDIVHALKMIVGQLYNNREGECPQQLYTPDLSVKALLAPYRLRYRGPWL